MPGEVLVHGALTLRVSPAAANGVCLVCLVGDEDDDASVEFSCRAPTLLRARVVSHEPR